MEGRYLLLGILFAIELVIIFILVPGDWTETVIKREHALMDNRYTDETNELINATATRWYKKTMIDSGIYVGLYRHLIPSAEDKKNSKGMENLGSFWFNWLESRIDSLAYSVYHFYNRVALLMIWLPYFLILLIPSLYDGYNRWRIKRTNFDYSSSIVHHYSKLLTVLSVWSLVLLFLAPIVVEPTIIPAVIMLVCVLVGHTVGNLQKRI
jgi:hypothetical protein